MIRGRYTRRLFSCAHAQGRPRVMLGAWNFVLSVAISNLAMRSRGGCDASSEKYRNSA
jgi:hypothetical protein